MGLSSALSLGLLAQHTEIRKHTEGEGACMTKNSLLFRQSLLFRNVCYKLLLY